MNPGKHQSIKQRGQDLGWKVHEGAPIFLHSYTMHELRNRNVSVVYISLVLCMCIFSFSRAFFLFSYICKFWLVFRV